MSRVFSGGNTAALLLCYAVLCHAMLCRAMQAWESIRTSKTSPAEAPARKLYLRRVLPSATEQEIRTVFGRYGAV